MSNPFSSRPTSPRQAKQNSSSVERRLAYKRLERASLLLDQAESYWTLYCEAMDYAEKILSLPMPVYAGPRTMRHRALAMLKRVQADSDQRSKKLLKVDVLLSHLVTLRPPLYLVKKSESQVSA